MNNQQTMDIKGITYEYADAIEKITIADSFVMPSNKVGEGNGEAKLYVGQRDSSVINFFGGKRGFGGHCILLKSNLLKYLNDAKGEYFEPSYEYRRKNSLRELWYERINRISGMDEIIHFNIEDQNQLAGPRVYVNASDGSQAAYKLIREIPLPVISYLDIVKLKSHDGDILYYFKLVFNIESAPEGEIEKEMGNDLITIKTPFDPNKIKVRTMPSTIGQIIDDINDNIINLSTEFQRRSDLWDDKKKSRFIESLLLKLPIPAFYFNEKEENDLEVIDGLQRISTIRDFAINKRLKLVDLEFLKEYNDYSFDNLPVVLSRRIKTFPITTYIIEKGTPDEVKYNIFKRVNTGGLELTTQEIRHAINNGKPANLIADLVRGEDDQKEDKTINIRKEKDGSVISLYATIEGKAFVRATDNKIGTFRMEDRDFANRFVSFYLIPYTEYEPDLDTFMNKGMAKINTLSDQEISMLKNRFKIAMNLAFDIFEKDAFRKRFNIEDARKPINKALFEVLSVNFAKLENNEVSLLLLRKELFKEKFIALHNELDGKFLRSITQGTASKENVERRFRDIERIIKETLI